jgi:hypothetical protein
VDGMGWDGMKKRKKVALCDFFTEICRFYLFILYIQMDIESPFLDKKEETIVIRGVKKTMGFYTLTKGSTIYRGDNAIYRNKKNIRQLNGPTFFGHSSEAVEKYGVVFSFICDKDYKLLALDDYSTISKLYNDAPRDIQTILKENYGYGYIEEGEQRRNSVLEKDRMLVDYLCSLGYNGYATDMMENVDSFIGDFHREIVLCDPSSLTFNGQLTPESDVQNKLEDERLRKISEQDKEKRNEKKRNRNVVYESPPRNVASAFDFGSPVRMDESPPRRNVASALNFGTPPRNTPSVFRTPGGKKRSLKRKPKKTRTRTRTRTNKTRKTKK